MTWLDDLVVFAQGRLDERVRSALWGRGVTDEQMDLYRIGHLNSILPSLPMPEAKEFCEWARVDGRIDDVFVLPLTNALGQILGVQFRHVEQGRKGYREYVLERDEPVLFGLAQALPAIWKTERAFIVEGAFDVFPVQRVVPYTFATLTARVPEQLIRFLRRLVSHVSLGYDMDKTGREACARFTTAHGVDFEVQTINYPPARTADGKVAKDPSEIWEAWGDDRLQAFLLSTQETYYATNL
jgi:DNA primase